MLVALPLDTGGLDDTVIHWGAVIIAVGVVMRYIVIPVWSGVRHSYAILKRVDAEFRPNAGSTIRDSLDRIEAKADKSTAWIRAAWATSEGAMYEVLTDGALVWANSSYLELVARSFEEVEGFGWVNVICDDDRDRVRAEAVKAGQDRRQFMAGFEICRPDGERVPVTSRATPLLTDTDGLVGFLGHIIPTRRKDDAA